MKCFWCDKDGDGRPMYFCCSGMKVHLMNINGSIEGAYYMLCKDHSYKLVTEKDWENKYNENP